jgi:hypothetical protein
MHDLVVKNRRVGDAAYNVVGPVTDRARKSAV